MRNLRLLAGLLPLMFMASTTANATTIIKTLTLSASNFSNSASPVSVTFGLNFDNSASFSNNFAGVTQISSNTFGPLRIGYVQGFDTLTIVGGNGTAGPGSCGNSPGSFCSFISNISALNPSSNFFLLVPAVGNFGFASTVAVANAGVPEPATWAMMALGFGLVGFALRKRSSVRTTVAYA